MHNRILRLLVVLLLLGEICRWVWRIAPGWGGVVYIVLQAPVPLWLLLTPATWRRV